jgi:3'(2'), 5'-bisphosphate nucleotidase
MTDDADLAADLAASAGAVLLELRDRVGGTVEPKELKDLGDRAAHEHLMARLAEARPFDAVLSEEGADDDARLVAARLWIVDPLDGTREFSERDGDGWRSDFAVHVALWERASGLVAGAVGLPARGRVYSSSSPPTRPTPPVDGPLRVAVSRTRPPALLEALAERMPLEFVPMGSAGVKAMAVVDGTVDAYLHEGGQYEWDSAAPVAVARAAGLHTSRVDGAPLVYNNRGAWLPDLVICRPPIAAALLQAVADIKEATEWRTS